MIKKQQQFIPKGMNQDIAETKVQSEFAHSIKNLRVVTDEKDGTLSLVTEKGTLEKQFPIDFFKHSNQISNEIVPTYYSCSFDTTDVVMENGYPYVANTMYLMYLRTKVTFKFSFSSEFEDLIIREGRQKIDIKSKWFTIWNYYLCSNNYYTEYVAYDYNPTINETTYQSGPVRQLMMTSANNGWDRSGHQYVLTDYIIGSYDYDKQIYTVQLYVPILISATDIPDIIFENIQYEDNVGRIEAILQYVGGSNLVTYNNKLKKAIYQSFKNRCPLFDLEIGYKSNETTYTLSKDVNFKNILNATVIKKDLILFGITSIKYRITNGSYSQDLYTLNNKNSIVKIINFNDITENSIKSDHIKFLYTGNLNFNINNPIKTYISYESENQQRIYWIDGLNQPRVININKEYEFYDDNNDNHFNFCTPVYLNESINITKKIFGGFFHSGIIQYFFTYIDQNQQESKIFYTSPLYYITNNDRALSPEENSQNSFVINIINANANYLQRDKLRIYSIYRTSINATPVAKLISETQLKQDTSDITIVDTGNIGINIDPQIILMAGCDLFVPKTMEVKDNTMFFGNIKLENNGSLSKIKQMNLNFECSRASSDEINSITSSDYNKIFISTNNSSINKYKGISLKGALFKNDFQLNGFDQIVSDRCYKQSNSGSDNEIKTFMYQEEYMLGIQLLHKSGEWSQPIWVGDFIMNKPIYFSPLINAPIFQCFYNKTFTNTLLNNDYIAIRPLVVCNDISNARVICQGVINPTLYDKNDGGEFSGSNGNYSTRYVPSWFFRPINSNTETDYFGFGTSTNSFAGNITTNDDFCRYGLTYLSPDGDIRNEVQNNDNRFTTSKLIVSFNSPEIEFGKIIELPKNIVANKVGYITVQSLKYDLNIQTSTTSKDINLGFNADVLKNKVMHYSFKSNIKTWCTFLGGLSWRDKSSDDTYCYYVYPWENDQSYSLFEQTDENDIVYGAPYLKTLSNWRYSQENWYFDENNIVKKGLNFSKVVNNSYTSIESFIYEKDVDKLLVGIYGDCSKNYFEAKTTNDSKTIISDQNVYYTEASFLNAHPNAIDVACESHGTSVYNDIPQAARNAHAFSNEKGEAKESYDGDAFYFWYTWYGYTKNVATEFNSQTWGKTDNIKNSFTRIQYKSTPHAILSDALTLLPNVNDAPFQSSNTYYDYGKFSLVSLINEDYDVNKITRFKGRIFDDTKNKYVPTQTSLQESTWYIAGDTVKLEPDSIINVKWEKGDAYFQKYHCLKTYPYSHESQNSIIDILSFMIYTRVNLNGCYDDKSRNDILHIDNTNFNKLNEVYNQMDNFITYSVIDESNLNNKFPNLITWGKQKSFGESVDPWTNIHLVNVLDLDGSLGEITALKLWNSKLISFQQKGISVIKYNENTMVQPISGAPIEIANSNKVSGKEILSNQFGCQNEWSIVNTKSGLYFSDDYNHRLYVLSDGIKCISDELGFKSYLKNKNYNGVWNPERGTWNDIHTIFTPINALHTYYDQQLGDIYFTDGSSCLTYNENLNLFTSFYDYTDVYVKVANPTGNPKTNGYYEYINDSYTLTNDTLVDSSKVYYSYSNRKLFDFVNIENKNYWIINDFTNNTPLFFEHRASDSLNIFGDNNYKDYAIELTANIDPYVDKIFDTVEIRGDAYISGSVQSGYNIVSNVNTTSLPFDTIQVNNEYQDTGIKELQFTKDIKTTVSKNSMKQKFRIWRAQIGRDATNVRDRIRNYWSRIKLTKNGTSNLRAKIHDIVVDIYE